MNENDILEKVAQFEKRAQETKGEIQRVEYYEKFQMSGIDFKNIFITTEKDVDGNITYHVYSGESSKEIMSITSNEELNINSELKPYLSDINLEETVKDNERQLGKRKKISVLQEINTTTKVNEKQQLGTQLGIEKYNQSNSKFIKIIVVYSDDLKEIDGKGGESTKYAFAAMRQDGTIQRIDNLLEMDRSFGNINAEETIQFNDDGTAKKDASTISRYRIRGTDETLAIQKDLGGNLDIYYGGRGKGSNEIVETKLETSQTRVMTREERETQTNIKGVYYEQKQIKEGNIHFEEHGEDEIPIIDADGDETTMTHMHPDDLIPDTDMTWEQFANKCGYRGEGAIEHAQEVFENAKEKNKDKTNQEIVDEITEEAEEEFSNPRR